MKTVTSLLLGIVLSLFSQVSLGAFASDVPPPIPVPDPQPEPVVLEATMLVKSLRSGKPVKINIKSRGVIPVVLLVESEVNHELFGGATMETNSLLEVAVPRFTKRYDVNRDGILDYIFIFRTQDVMKGESEADDDVTLILTVTYDDQPVEFSTQVETVVPKSRAWFKKGKRR